MNKYLKFLLPISLVVITLVLVVVLYTARPQAERRPVEIKEPLVSVAEVESRNLNIPVFTRGTVTPGTEIPLVSEVSGPVVQVSENFARGGFFKKGEVLIKVDPVEYEVTLKKASAAVAQSLQMLKQAEAERRVRGAAKGLSDNALARFDYQYQQARAQHDAARAELEAVNMQKRKTIIVAPFDGRVRLATVNNGQYLRPGVQLGLIYAVNAAEVRLPLADSQLALVDVPYRFGTDGSEGPKVTLVGDYGGRKFRWEGQVVRSESGVDEFNRLLYVIAQIPDPYAMDPKQPDRPPLTAGNFVEAVIEGRHFQNVMVVPRRALRNGSQVWTVSDDNRLIRRDIDILYKGKDVIYVRNGLQDGERVVLSQLDIAVEGMRVRSHRDPSMIPDESTPAEGMADSAEPARQALDALNQAASSMSATDKAAAAMSARDALDALNAGDQAGALANAREALNVLKQSAPTAPETPTAKPTAQNPAATAQTAPAAPKASTPEPATVQAPAVAPQPGGASPLADLINDTESAMQGGAPATPSTLAREIQPLGDGSLLPVASPRLLKESAQ